MSAPVAHRVRPNHVSAIQVAARTARLAAAQTGNLDKCARDGVVHVQPLLLGHGIGVIDGHTTSGSLGVGLGAVRRMADHFDIVTTPDVGTLAGARLRAPGGWTQLAVDGLGHGEPAAKAADTAVRTFQQDPSRPLGDLVVALHRSLRHTRGAAVALLRSRDDHVSFRGFGAISVAVLSGAGVRYLLSTPGVAGLGMDHPIQYALSPEPGDTIVMHSDGFDDRWPATAPGHMSASPPLLVAQFVRDHRRSHADGGVVALRHRIATT